MPNHHLRLMTRGYIMLVLIKNNLLKREITKAKSYGEFAICNTKKYMRARTHALESAAYDPVPNTSQ
jgi:hypothetical protein